VARDSSPSVPGFRTYFPIAALRFFALFRMTLCFGSAAPSPFDKLRVLRMLCYRSTESKNDTSSAGETGNPCSGIGTILAVGFL
jgi:hypothetical protein